MSSAVAFMGTRVCWNPQGGDKRCTHNEFRFTPEGMRAELSRAGFEPVSEHDLLSNQIFLVFRLGSRWPLSTYTCEIQSKSRH